MSRKAISASTICALASLSTSLATTQNSSEDLSRSDSSFDSKGDIYFAPINHEVPNTPTLDAVPIYLIEGPKTDFSGYIKKHESPSFQHVGASMKTMGSQGTGYQNNLKPHGIGHMRFGNSGNRYK